jgi:hypothetical protein
MTFVLIRRGRSRPHNITGRTDIDWAALCEPVARLVWGKPTRETSKELRWGTNGSRCLDRQRGVWFDHEVNCGGGASDLLVGLKVRLDGHVDHLAGCHDNVALIHPGGPSSSSTPAIIFGCRSGASPDGALGEVFLDAAKQNSGLDAFAADAAILVSLLLQHGATPAEIGHALRRAPDGTAASLVGAVVDRLAEMGRPQS